MLIPVDTAALMFVAASPAVKDGDHWVVHVGVIGPDDAGKLELHFDADPGPIQPRSEVKLDKALVDVRRAAASAVKHRVTAGES